MLIPPEAVAPETLRAIAEEFVSRDGTQTGDLRHEADKILRLLACGQAVLCFEADGEEGGTCAILMRAEWEKRQRQNPET